MVDSITVTIRMKPDTTYFDRAYVANEVAGALGDLYERRRNLISDWTFDPATNTARDLVADEEPNMPYDPHEEQMRRHLEEGE